MSVRFFKTGCFFDYCSSSQPLKIPNDEKCGLLSPKHPANIAEKLDKYRQYILPMINSGIDLYSQFSESRRSREATLSETCLSAFQHLENIKFIDAALPKYDAVIVFGTFDLFHELHKKLLDDARKIGREVIVYVNEDSHKFKRAIGGIAIAESKNAIIDSPEKRRRKVANYLGLKGTVKLKQGKHVEQLNATIQACQKSGKTVCVFGGNDQFENFPALLQSCFESKTPIVTKPRGETDTLLCTSDLKSKRLYEKIASQHTLDLTYLGMAFFKKRIDSKPAAVAYLMQLSDPPKTLTLSNRIIGLGTAEVCEYDARTSRLNLIKEGYTKSNKILLTLPVRSNCDFERARKILETAYRLVPDAQRDSTTCLLGCYKQEIKSTKDAIAGLHRDPLGYFSQDAMIFTALIILPKLIRTYLCKNVNQTILCYEPLILF